MSDIRLVVGLGNPGRQYEFTRHNIGFLVAKEIARQYKLRFSRSIRVHGWLARGECAQDDFILLLPRTYMNNSGVALRQVVRNKGIDLKNVLVVTDDFNLAFGQLRLRAKGSDGGHNGLKSIIAQLGTQDFARLRIGIGKPPSADDTVDYVLGEFSRDERAQVADVVKNAVCCCESWLTEGTSIAISRFNQKGGI